MTSKINHCVRLLVAGAFAVSAAVTQAAAGVNIVQSDETKVAVGMSPAEVQQYLGRPQQIFKYLNQPGPTWTYEVLGAPFGITKFDVDFGPDGKVASASERIIGHIW